ncbi:hypothetical protein GCM10011611_16160 [Aliidongia dinghuensis]|uniref:DUF3617 family protein n=1 Tax=Aliidongia dinghuensis TaxID=1867774 RepID=A0A8J3E2L5_9PROT|nr:DUF3617 domain-containing protein [Aliidongia dinghuensis]GGF11284.1 hypothetical protein GCM10011611_16160 [Aliidongia dinghuensis]
MTKRGIILPATILAPALAVLVSGAARASDIPLDTGLWEMQVTTTIAGITIPPAMQEKMKKLGVNPPGGTPTSSTRQMCVTDETLARFGEPNQGGKCRQENVQRSAKGLSFDLVCESPQNNGHGHVDVVFDDRTHVHGTVKMSGVRTDSSGNTIPLSVDATQTGHWVSTDCGSVKPMN